MTAKTLFAAAPLSREKSQSHNIIWMCTSGIGYKTPPNNTKKVSAYAGFNLCTFFTERINRFFLFQVDKLFLYQHNLFYYPGFMIWIRMPHMLKDVCTIGIGIVSICVERGHVSVIRCLPKYRFISSARFVTFLEHSSSFCV